MLYVLLLVYKDHKQKIHMEKYTPEFFCFPTLEEATARGKLLVDSNKDFDHYNAMTLNDFVQKLFDRAHNDLLR